MAEKLDDLLNKHREALTRRVDDIDGRLDALREKRDRYLVKAEEEKAKARPIVEEIKAIERDELIPARNDLSRVARATGGRSLSDNP